ncbi:hypothetical protein E8E13_003987 [Curvularia kusanoi]|uniref:WSC domain-containing protein n=1 Tax=Curvularia kusanoi TaxID=90978 RepID=A0A9P4T5Y7_CURKU|nr:hypothetical protein E8E13_003987 [Curvularia kusanoi]
MVNVVVATITLLLSGYATAFTQSYCSSQNTGSGSPFFWTYQTNGKCTDHCAALGTYAFAVIQFTNCWCTNYIPATTTDISDCQVDCPGYPSEKCGDKDAGLYIYIEGNGQPSGTAGGGGSSKPSSTASSAPNKPSSTLQTVATSSATAMSTSVQVITESGAVVTRTIIYQPTAVTSQPQASSSSSSNTGAIVGGVVGGIAAILAIVGGILFFLWRRRKQQRAEQDQQAGITRNVSTMSKAGLLGGRVATDPHHPPPIATSVSHAGSRHDNESISPGSQRRYSQPMMIDSRLNPETVLMYHPTFGNSSRDSLGSIDDSRDFGRQLNVRNPDPH